MSLKLYMFNLFFIYKSLRDINKKRGFLCTEGLV